jgi:hypothetical protein
MLGFCIYVERRHSKTFLLVPAKPTQSPVTHRPITVFNFLTLKKEKSIKEQPTRKERVILLLANQNWGFLGSPNGSEEFPGADDVSEPGRNHADCTQLRLGLA